MNPMHPRTVIAASCAALLANAGPALAESSFGTAFFVSMDRASDGEVRVDWIGSAMIWALIAMSVASVALIWIAFASNRTDDILPPEEAASLRRAVAEGRFAEALEASRTRGGVGPSQRSSSSLSPSIAPASSIRLFVVSGSAPEAFDSRPVFGWRRM